MIQLGNDSTRGKKWTIIDRDRLPTLERMVNDPLGLDEVADSQEAMEARYRKDLYHAFGLSFIAELV